jgi:hypothetical protein
MGACYCLLNNFLYFPIREYITFLVRREIFTVNHNKYNYFVFEGKGTMCVLRAAKLCGCLPSGWHR